MAKSINTVDEYLAQLPVDVKRTLAALRGAIKSAAPMAEENIGYNIPFYRYNGHLAAFFAAKNHCSFVTMSSSVVKNFKSELKPFKVSGTTIHFTPDNSLPAGLVKKIIKARIKENLSAHTAPKKKIPAKKRRAK